MGSVSRSSSQEAVTRRTQGTRKHCTKDPGENPKPVIFSMSFVWSPRALPCPSCKSFFCYDRRRATSPDAFEGVRVYMPRLSSVLVACASTICALTVTGSVTVSAQGRPATQVSTQASVHSGRIKGVVKDDAGQTVGGVSIVAMGTILAAARSDERGSFSLDLPAGEYILRAACDGYVSTYREPVRVQTSALLEKTITITRQRV